MADGGDAVGAGGVIGTAGVAPGVQLVNLRAGRSLQREVNVFGEYFPARIDGRPIRRFLLHHTRHLPRDVLQLMKSLQRYAPASPTEPTFSDLGAAASELEQGLREAELAV